MIAKAKLPRITEKQFQRQVVELAGLCGWMSYHTHDSRRCTAGFPDLVLVRSCVVYAELKVGKNRATKEQTLWLERLRAAGQRAYLWTPDDFDDIRQVLQNAR